jgi:hypothetical protein
VRIENRIEKNREQRIENRDYRHENLQPSIFNLQPFNLPPPVTNLENTQPPEQKSFLIGVVGVCASGKSTLIRGLTERGYRARHIAQEHSYVKYMWQHITNPDVLIFLDVSYPMTVKRRQMSWLESDWEEQQRRLSHAREHAHLYLQTDQLNEGEVLDEVVQFLLKFLANGQFHTTPHP